ncbi:MAG: flagellar FliJ family protein [Alphaproteobacteria bacterium]
MSSTLDKLIRYHRFLLDEKRRALREMEDAEARIVAAIETLEMEIRREQTVAGGSTEVGFAYGGYAARAIRRRTGLKQQLAAAQAEVEAAREALALAFENLKKYEITRDIRDEAARQEAARREQVFLDEIALNQHRRREGGQ